MRAIKPAWLGLAMTVLMTGCCCVERVCDWVHRPFRPRCEPAPAVICPPCGPTVPSYPVTPIPMEPVQPPYETGN
jgi:hypothetical protein